jgi:hypothetical protein
MSVRLTDLLRGGWLVLGKPAPSTMSLGNGRVVATTCGRRRDMAEATHEDAVLLVQLAKLGAEIGEARTWVWSDEFIADFGEFNSKYPSGSKEFGFVGAVAGYFETVATLWKHGLINEALLFDWLAVFPLWNRMENILVGMREDSGVPQLWENFQALAEAQVSSRV